MKKTLLEKALEYKTRKGKKKELGLEGIELSLAWLRGDITKSQAMWALGMKKGGKVLRKGATSQIYVFLCRGIREAFDIGEIKIINSLSKDKKK